MKKVLILSLSIGFLQLTVAQEANKQTAYYKDVTTTHLPYQDLQRLSMDAAIADLDNDGDMDIIIANEHRPNILLINDGTGKFTNESAKRIPQVNHDSEDIGIADFDGDGDLDIIVVSEDDKTNELYLNNGDGTFSDAGDRIPVTGTSNSVVVHDINMDGFVDVLIGNNGQNNVLINDGTGHFTDETMQRFGEFIDVTQDLTLADIDNDGDLDVLVANEDNNRILINSGKGFYTDESKARLPYRNTPEETREVVAADIDGDGDMDMLYGNVQAFVSGAVKQNRFLLNDGKGFFSDITTTHLPQDDNRCFGVAFLDIDHDGDEDIITGNTNGDGFAGMTPFSVYLNDGKGKFTDETTTILPESIKGRGFDIDFVDLNGDGIKDLFLSNRGSQDFLLFGLKN
ncbi:VCBS repeat protein [Roseivirga pacifica]|uniref:Repeat domain-containing protein n=1 Tax=Roseivirga pacifica TaxID=1267423 RepID=A0A1I0Q8Z7_9BACT|nr:VCBS repeat-containing protein [Roseivirga pacifica]RKQ43140.1 VCBS repeat protein [Roseivirga pacifica]SEW23345.1 Repeat domain-containing protein [Roseivirga pacifica]